MAGVGSNRKREAAHDALVVAPHSALASRPAPSLLEARRSPAYQALRGLHGRLTEQQREVVRLPAPRPAAASPDVSERVAEQRARDGEAPWNATPLELPAQAPRALAAYRAAQPPRALRPRDRLSVCG